MSDDAPDSAPGPEARRLDADRAREELGDTLDEIEKRLTPPELLRSARDAWRRSPGRVAAVVGAPLAIIGLVVAVRVARHRRG